jgi:iron(III) transport system substrate-binding protein
MMRRREALAGLAGIGVALAGARVARGRPRAEEVVLYSSVDPEFLSPIVDAYQKSAGVRVRVLGDTEATKTTGLTQRLIAERDKPRCDVWWSSEALGTVELAKAGLLDVYECAGADANEGWPGAYRDAGHRWYGLALRARGIVYNTERAASPKPASIADLLDPRFKGRVGMARPRFGTTRTHMAAIAGELGDSALRDLLIRLKAQGVRLFDGNSSVVRACATGEIHAGLTDNDDVYAGKRNGWPVELAYCQPEGAPSSTPSDAGRLLPGLRKLGNLTIPNTIALVHAGPNPDRAKRLIDYVLGGAVERALARSESRNVPVDRGVAGEFSELKIPSPWTPDPGAVVGAAPRADALCDEILGS